MFSLTAVMAQVRVQERLGEEGALPGSSQDQQHKLSQYEKIARFQDSILSGSHPSIRLSPNLIASAISSIHPLDAPTKPGAPDVESDKTPYSAANLQHSDALTTDTVPSATVGATKPHGFRNTEINPILLEKSDELVKAELQLQRQRLERALREDVEQRRSVVKSGNQGEALADFDLSDVLSKALTLVQATASSTAAHGNVHTTTATNTTNDNDAASDSFDDNTFYSSQHNTPSPGLTSRVDNKSEEGQAPRILAQRLISDLPPTTSVRFEPVDVEQVSKQTNVPQPHQAHNNSNLNPSGSGIPSTLQNAQVPGLSAHAAEFVPSGSKYNTGVELGQLQGFGGMDVDRQTEAHGARSCHPPREQYVDMHPPSPLMRPSERLHVDPRLGQASPLTATRRLPPNTEATSISSTGTPTQVVALRNEPITVTSPESSPQGGRTTDKRKGKKKKRKVDKQAIEVGAVPCIKLEPRSPSPVMAPSYLRPNKRQRYNQNQPDEALHEEGAYEPQASELPRELRPIPTNRDDRIPVGYERPGPYPQRAVSTAISGGDAVYRREYVDERYAPGGPYVMEHPSAVPTHHQAHSSLRRSSSHFRPADGYQHPSYPYQNTYEASPIVSRREGDGFMVPPRPQPTRIIVDAYGREYIEPPRPSVARHSVAPTGRFGEPEIIYERAAPRATPRHTAVEPYEEGGTVYRRSSPTYMPRRVVTQPEYISHEYRDNRPQENSSRPMVPQGGYVEYMAPPERRHVEEGPREFMARGASLRPTEPVRYQVARDYGRVQSVRPEAPVRQYATSVHPESRRETAQPYTREYGTLTTEPGVVRHEYSMRPVEQYYDAQMRGGEVTFVEGPRGATQEVVYADDARREIYR